MSTQTNCPPDAIIDLSVPTYFTQGSVLFTGAGGIISQNNASFSWDNVGFILKASSAQFKGSPWYDVKAYGAKGDGVTDDSTAIQAAITAASVSGGPVFFPSGTYLYATGLTCAVRNVQFVGAGKRATILNYTGSGVALTIGTTSSGNSDGTAVIGLSIVGTSSATVGLDIIQANSFLLQQVLCSGFSTGKAFRVNGSNTGTVIESDFNTSSIGISLESNGALTPNLITFIGGSCLNNATAVSSLATALGNRFLGVNFEGNTASPCIVMNGAIGWLIQGCWFEGNLGGASTYSIELGTSISSYNNSFISNYLAEANVTYFLHIITGVNNLVLGNSNGSTGMTAIVRCETLGHSTQIAFNMNQSGSGVILSDGSGTVDQFQVGFGSTFTKDAYGYSFNAPIVGTGSAPLFIRAHAAGQNPVTYQNNSGAATGGIAENGSFAGPVNCLTKTAATYAIPASEINTEYDNSGAGAQVAFTLPASTVGLQYVFIVLTAQNVRILGHGAETIKVGASTSTATTGHIDNATSGGVIRLSCHVAGTWIATYQQGTWTVT